MPLTDQVRQQSVSHFQRAARRHRSQLSNHVIAVADEDGFPNEANRTYTLSLFFSTLIPTLFIGQILATRSYFFNRPPSHGSVLLVCLVMRIVSGC